MKAAQGLLLVFAGVAIVLSLAPLVADAGPIPQNPTPDTGGDGGSATWHVTCVYDGQERLVSKTCASGGRQTCHCP